MSTPVSTTRTDENSSFIRQSYLRGHLAPAFGAPPKPTPPPRTCPRCFKAFNGPKTMCLTCRKETYPRQISNYDCFLDTCATCKCKTLHLGPGWCVMCHAAPNSEFPLYCEECVTVMNIPLLVKDDQGGSVDMVSVPNLWCVTCEGMAESWMRLDNSS